MSKLHDDQPAGEEVRLERGELRKPDDRRDQPGQSVGNVAVDEPANGGNAVEQRCTH